MDEEAGFDLLDALGLLHQSFDVLAVAIVGVIRPRRRADKRAFRQPAASINVVPTRLRVQQLVLSVGMNHVAVDEVSPFRLENVNHPLKVTRGIKSVIIGCTNVISTGER